MDSELSRESSMGASTPNSWPQWKEDLYEIQQESTLLLEQVFAQALERAELKWKDRISLLQRRHEMESQHLQSQLAEAQDQLNETVKMYNGIISNLQDEMDVVKERSMKTEALLKNELRNNSSQIEDTTSSYQAAIASLTKQLTEAREANSNNELKFQQRKLVLLQSNESLRQEKEELSLQVEDLGAEVKELREALAVVQQERRFRRASQLLLAGEEQAQQIELAAQMAQVTVSG